MAEMNDFKRQRAEIRERYDPILASAGTMPRERKDIQEQLQEKLRKITEAESRFLDSKLFDEAGQLDIPHPSYSESDFWQQTEKDPVLSTKGRLVLRRAIDEEKLRRREFSSWWWKSVLIPAITSITGLVGVVTGLVAVLHKK